MRQWAGESAPVMSVQHEWIESSKAALGNVEHELGRVVASQWYKESEKQPELSVEEEAAQLPCPACSI
jgi:hypothetical protein